MHRVSFPLEPRAESPSISEESSVQKFPPSLSQFEFRPSCDTFFFLYISRAKNSIRRFYYQTRILSSAIDPTNHFQFSLYLGYKYDVPSLLLSHFLIPPSPFFLYLSVIPKTDSFQWKKIGKESPQRYEGQGSRRIREQEFFRRELRRWRKFGHANGKSFGWDRGIIGSTGWSEAADNYTDIDGSMMGRRGSRISKGRPCYFLTPFPFPFSFFSRPPCPPLGATFSTVS